MPLVIGPVRVAMQTGAKFNFGSAFIVVNKNNLHNEAEVNSFNQGSKNFQNSFSNAPDLEFRKVRTDIINNSNFNNFLRKAGYKTD
ncbi:hypothetical protein Pmgp_00444 [Pelotomaculum propionicicum]|uniref:Uncharacterized protein n=1 Tax=Pelotomaculum propionicicum TaxID=258475 RepID=A0A4Y7RVV7_9FIRM|nr:hypothetical protein Pmgp_00444 [Pelotomaculum propionicicum]